MNNPSKCLLLFRIRYVQVIYCLSIAYWSDSPVFSQLLKYDRHHGLILGTLLYCFWWFSAGKQLIYYYFH